VNQEIVDLRIDANEEFVEKAVFLSVANQWPFLRKKWPFLRVFAFLTAQMSVFMVFCGPHLPLAFQFVCGPGGGGPQTNWKASGRSPFFWLRRRRRPRDTVQIVVFVGGPLLKTFVPLGIFAGFKVRYQPICSPISGDTPRLETYPEKRMPEKNDGAIICKGSALMKRQHNL